jgi:hypothetical protein
MPLFGLLLRHITMTSAVVDSVRKYRALLNRIGMKEQKNMRKAIATTIEPIVHNVRIQWHGSSLYK